MPEPQTSSYLVCCTLMAGWKKREEFSPSFQDRDPIEIVS